MVPACSARPSGRDRNHIAAARLNWNLKGDDTRGKAQGRLKRNHREGIMGAFTKERALLRLI